MRIPGFQPPPSGVIAYSQAACYRIVKGSLLEKLVLRINALIEENRRLMFWFSTATLLAAAPTIFLAASTIGVGAAMNNHFGLRERRIEHLSWETTQGLVGGIVFVCGLLFHYHIQCVWGGIAAGSHIYRLWNGQVHKRGLRGWQAMDVEMHLLTKEFASWVQAVIPQGKVKKKGQTPGDYKLTLPSLSV